MTDRELLELAAKAAGIDTRRLPDAWPERFDDDQWNPLIDDGDALRLAVKLHFSVDHNHRADDDRYVMVSDDSLKTLATEEAFDEGQRETLTRRVIVRAAAEIGKAMP